MNYELIFIGLTGKKGAGKNFIASLIREIVATKFKDDNVINRTTIKNLAEPVYDTLLNILGLQHSYVVEEIIDLLNEDRDMKENYIPPHIGKNMSIRKLLQIIGTEFGRNMINENIWVDTLLHEVFLKVFSFYNTEYKSVQSVKDKIKRFILIIPDVRFNNEIIRIKKVSEDKSFRNHIIKNAVEINNKFENGMKMVYEKKKDSGEFESCYYDDYELDIFDYDNIIDIDKIIEFYDKKFRVKSVFIKVKNDHVDDKVIDNHSSESGVDDNLIDYVIDNKVGERGYVEKQVFNILSAIFSEKS